MDFKSPFPPISNYCHSSPIVEDDPLLTLLLATHWSRLLLGPRRKFARRFAEGIGKLAGNIPGDRRKKKRRLAARMPEATGLAGRVNRPYPGVRTAEPHRSAGKPPVPGFFGYVGFWLQF
ncbi:hypothetical protein B296_00009692 [Ensete ventricosum]|uniref:Uncharacterized protein n=1 Tax=Ensete ventricosum TaxID=4639 RepID=A0A426Y758_ENSVE|nr:hypothetical protein B296_00009692 [Ensete ventricosum]